MTNLWHGAPIRSPANLSALIADIAGGPLASGSQTRWVFRGHVDIEYRLASSLVRAVQLDLEGRPTEEVLRIAEDRLLQYAHAWGLGTSPWGPADDVQLLAELQHHGIPTRLLDVTANPFTALYFACQRSEREDGIDTDGVVVAINVTGVEELRTNKVQDLTFAEFPQPESARWRRALDGSAESGRHILIKPSFLDARMAAQEGMFLTGACPDSPSDGPFDCMPGLGANLPGVASALLNKVPRGIVLGDKMPGPGVLAIRVPASLKAEARTALATTFNRSPETLFPDIDGLRESLEGTRLRYDAFSTAILGQAVSGTERPDVEATSTAEPTDPGFNA